MMERSSVRGNAYGAAVDVRQLGAGLTTTLLQKRQVRKGTWQEIQTIAVTAANDLLAEDNSTFFVLSFGGEVTGPILANANGSCEPAVSEVQVISTSTSGEGRAQIA